MDKKWDRPILWNSESGETDMPVLRDRHTPESQDRWSCFTEKVMMMIIPSIILEMLIKKMMMMMIVMSVIMMMLMMTSAFVSSLL